MTLTDNIKRKALELGFDLVGVTNASPLDAEQMEFLADWLKAGYAARMNYMHRNLEKRIDPAKLLENAQSIIVVGLNYKPPMPSVSLRSHDASLLRSKTAGMKQSHPAAPQAQMGKVAQYAQYEDYHPFIKNRLSKLSDFIISITDKDLQFRICVDSAPLAERAFAVRAGLGFIGKNRMLINPTFGPQIFLGEIITTLKLQPDEPTRCHSERSKESPLSTTTHCASCNKCIAACPTGALRADGQFDAGKCINYLTIEYKGEVPPDLAKKIGNRLFGCDDCVLACPYQQNAPPYRNKQFKFYKDRAELNVDDVLSLSEESFKAGFADSVIKRLGLAGLKRNAQICRANK
jgi:epoxyqueuosine reductase